MSHWVRYAHLGITVAEAPGALGSLRSPGYYGR